MTPANYIATVQGQTIVVDHTGLYDIMIALSEMHGRTIARMASSGDMEECTRLAESLVDIQKAHDSLKSIADVMRKDNKEWCAWLLREVWGKSGNLRAEDSVRIDQLANPGETPLEVVLRVSGATETEHRPFSEAARADYRQQAQRILEN